MVGTNHRTDDERVDAGSEYSFPASDPPAYMGGSAITGAPPREDDAQTASEKRTGRDATREIAEQRREGDGGHDRRGATYLAAGAAAAGILGGAAVWARATARAIEARHPPVGDFVEIGAGRRLHYVSRGRGRPVVLIHGASAQLQDMTASLMPTLARDHLVVAFDRPGHGYSDRAPYRATDEAQARAIHEGVRRLGLEKPVIVGHSMGGGIAMAYGMLFPEELTGIVFISGLAFPELRPNYLKFAPPALPLIGELASHTFYQPLQRWMVPSMLRKFFSPQEIPERFLREMPIEMLYRPQAIKANAEDQMMVLASLVDLSMHYDRYPLPVSIIAGAKDQTTDPHNHAIRLARHLPRSDLHVLPGLGHMVHHFAQDLVADEVARLFESGSG